MSKTEEIFIKKNSFSALPDDPFSPKLLTDMEPDVLLLRGELYRLALDQEFVRWVESDINLKLAGLQIQTRALIQGQQPEQSQR